MALLDLQTMEPPKTAARHGGGSRGSKGCGNVSTLSLLLC